MPTNAEFKLDADLCVVCLWASLGLVLTALFFTLGFEAEGGQLLALAG